jgi:LPS O-antigen subunit length determinant protein (WzzB/FepE family)
MNQFDNTSFNEEEGDINILDIFKNLWLHRKKIIIAILVGTAIGVIMALSTQRIFTVTTVMAPQMSTSDKSQLGGLAALAGINIGMNQNSDLSPLIYPRIVKSVPFKLELMNTPLNFSKVDHPVSLFEYFTKYNKPTVFGTIKKYTIGLPMLILKTIRKKQKDVNLPKDISDQPIHLTRVQYEIKKMLDDMVVLDADKKEGILTLTVQMIEPLATAQLAKKAQVLLQNEITKYKIEKTQADLNFIQGRFNVAKKEFEQVQVELALVTDRNRDLTSGISTVQRDRIQTKYSIYYSVYQDLSKQLEQAKIQVKKDTPMFSVLEPVTIPIESSKPNRPFIVLMWMFIGGIFEVGYIFGKKYFIELKKKLKEEHTPANNDV